MDTFLEQKKELVTVQEELAMQNLYEFNNDYAFENSITSELPENFDNAKVVPLSQLLIKKISNIMS
jgi:hypothetical protein